MRVVAIAPPLYHVYKWRRIMTSEVDICNRALDEIGSDPIMSLTDDTREANLCNRLYPLARDELLRKSNWNFAIKRVSLPQDATAPASQYAYQFVLPADYIKLKGFYRQGDLLYGHEDYSPFFQKEGNRILTNDTAVDLIYVARVADVNLFDNLFIEALALRMASSLAYSISNNRQLMETLKSLADIKLREAIASDGQESPQRRIRRSKWLTARDRYRTNIPSTEVIDNTGGV
jgi:hypothetical protein